MKTLQIKIFATIIVSISFYLISINFSNEADAAVLSKAPNNLGLVGYWSFNEGTSTVALDYSGNKNKGTLVNGPTWVNGKQGKALNFDGGDDEVLFSDPVVGSNFTFGAWIKPNSNFGTSGDGIFDTKPAAVGALRVFGNTGTPAQLCWDIGGNVPDQCLNDTGYNISDWTNQWHHIVLVLSTNSTTRLYVDGVSVGTVSNSVSASSHTFLVGVYNNTNYFNGLIDDVRIYNRALSASEIQALYNVGAVKYTPPNNLGLVGYWTFNEGTSTVALDYSGNKNKGTLVNGPTWVNGKQGKALNFDGSDDYVNAGSGKSLFPTGPVTITAWVNLRAYGAQGGTVLSSWGTTAGQNRYAANWDTNGKLTGNYRNTAGTATVARPSTASIGLNVWSFVATVIDGPNSIIDVYINGRLDNGTLSGAGAGWHSSTPPVTIGRLRVGDTYGQTNGLIDEVRVYNRALSAGAIKALYNVGAVKYTPPNNLGLVGYWSFNEGTSTVALDYSGNKNKGTLVNGPTWANGKQ